MSCVRWHCRAGGALCEARHGMWAAPVALQAGGGPLWLSMLRLQTRGTRCPRPRSLPAQTPRAPASTPPTVRHDDPIHGWLGASPDGLIESLSLDATAPAGAAGAAGGDDLSGGSDAGSTGAGAAGWQHAAPVRGAGPLAGPGRGILEIKCPYNRGQPELAVPPPHAIWYYMPQVKSRGVRGRCAGAGDAFGREGSSRHCWGDPSGLPQHF